MWYKKNYFIFFILFVLFSDKIYAWHCPPCVCTEHNSASLSQDYTDIQSVFLNKSIGVDLDNSIKAAKEALNKSKKKLNRLKAINFMMQQNLLFLKQVIALLSKNNKKQTLDVGAINNSTKTNMLKTLILLKEIK